MENTSAVGKRPTRRDRAYYRQRQKNRVFTSLAKFFAEESEAYRITKKQLADVMEKDPSQITRWLSAPSNLELDTISDLLLPMGAEMDHTIVRFSERSPSNHVHPLFAQVTIVSAPPQPALKPVGPTGITMRLATGSGKTGTMTRWSLIR